MALVVEDDFSWQEILSELLLDCDLSVDVALNLEEAQLLLKNRAYRLVIVDLSLANRNPHNTDGLHVLELVHDLNPGCQAILLTGFATVELAVSAVTHYGASTVLRKESFAREEFIALVHQALVNVPAPSSSSPPSLDEFPLQPIGSSFGKALVVDDDAGWQSLLSELLVEVGYEVRLCRSFGEAFSYLRREKFVLAVVDLSLVDTWTDKRSPEALEDLDGYRLLDCTHAGGLQTIVVSGIATSDDIERVYTEQGIFAYLEKQSFQRDVFLRLAEEAQANSDNKLTRLTCREHEVLDCLVLGLMNKEIAEKLFITPNTVKRHIKSIFEKLEVSNRAAAVAQAIGKKH
jgi:DNA-binding NarL/FixJ family response regulator